MAATVEVEGARELRRTLKALGSDLEDLKAVHQQVAAFVTSTGAARAPAVSGKLRATVRGTGAKTVATVRAGYKSVPYAGPIHWGWAARGIRPNPFLADAAADTEPVWTQLYTEGVQALIDTDIERYAVTGREQ